MQVSKNIYVLQDLALEDQHLQSRCREREVVLQLLNDVGDLGHQRESTQRSPKNALDDANTHVCTRHSSASITNVCVAK